MRDRRRLPPRSRLICAEQAPCVRGSRGAAWLGFPTAHALVSFLSTQSICPRPSICRRVR